VTSSFKSFRKFLDWRLSPLDNKSMNSVQRILHEGVNQVFPALKEAPSHKDFFDLLRPAFGVFERYLQGQLADFEPELHGYFEYILSIKGKSLRPGLVFLSAGAVGGHIGEKQIKAGAVVELIHLATLVHDDIIDDANTRRNKPTAYARWGGSTAVLLGDCIFSHALDLAASFDNTVVSRKISQAAKEVCQGEILQTQHRFNFDLTIERYLKQIEMKTAALFAVSCDLGAFLSGANAEGVTALRKFGTCLGVAYQIYDDCLDILGTEEKAGKSLRTDLKTGKLTLPLLLLVKISTQAEKERIRHLLAQSDKESFTEIIYMAKDKGTLHASFDKVREYLQVAEQQLDVLPSSPHKEALLAFITNLLGKTKGLIFSFA